jgi:ABC-type polysaccharide/polyol phosphate transport system ATPase subunit
MTSGDAPVISVRNLCKQFRVYERPSQMLGEVLFGTKRHRVVTALDDVSFELGRGEILGILGRNGAGKSTLLKTLTGVIEPTSGEISIQGKISHLLELGGGFHPHYTGRENIYFGGACMNMSRAEIEGKLDDIIAFSELGADIDRPFRTYSAGMQARLTFAVAISVDPEVMIIDEWLAVGDARFALKCYDKIREFRDHGVTILFVTHNYPTLSEFCDRGLVLDHGRVIYQGDPLNTILSYQRVLYGDQPKDQGAGETSPDAAETAAESTAIDAAAPEDPTAQFESVLAHFVGNSGLDFSKRMGSGEALFSRIAIVNCRGEPSTVLQPSEQFRLVLELALHKSLTTPAAGFFIKDWQGKILCSTDTNLFPASPIVGTHPAGSRLVVAFDLQCNFAGGRYFLGVALAGDDLRRIDVVHDVVMFEVTSTPLMHRDGVVNLNPQVLAVSSAADRPAPELEKLSAS